MRHLRSSSAVQCYAVAGAFFVLPHPAPATLCLELRHLALSDVRTNAGPANSDSGNACQMDRSVVRGSVSDRNTSEHCRWGENVDYCGYSGLIIGPSGLRAVRSPLKLLTCATWNRMTSARRPKTKYCDIGPTTTLGCAVLKESSPNAGTRRGRPTTIGPPSRLAPSCTFSYNTLWNEAPACGRAMS